MPDEAREVHPSIQRLSDFLGMSPGEVFEPAPKGSVGECVSFEEIVQYQRSAQMPSNVDAHLKQCSACASLAAAMTPEVERLQRFHEERERLEHEHAGSAQVAGTRAAWGKIFAWASSTRLAYVSAGVTAIMGGWLAFSILVLQPNKGSLELAIAQPTAPRGLAWDELAGSSSVQFQVTPVAQPPQIRRTKPLSKRPMLKPQVIVVTAQISELPLVPAEGKNSLEQQVSLAAASSVVVAEKAGLQNQTADFTKPSNEIKLFDIHKLASFWTKVVADGDKAGTTTQQAIEDSKESSGLADVKYDASSDQVSFGFSYRATPLRFRVSETTGKIRLYQETYLNETSQATSLENVQVGNFSVSAKGVTAGDAAETPAGTTRKAPESGLLRGLFGRVK
jgi:hypothetical protein